MKKDGRYKIDVKAPETVKQSSDVADAEMERALDDQLERSRRKLNLLRPVPTPVTHE